ncbi:cilia- and flagella-associated protein 74 isoform X1 [Coregonus clupeaformis]|uniref:cilia- and flagella-associated protein 74 isoform X1 n=1 Tax=Coregonus clupeaformis TaxID=59861 RepID=UPI001E1C81C1|nr:cilia- and flagella-associated protein 74 isoform X1 [Coregonus clupeaformis]
MDASDRDSPSEEVSISSFHSEYPPLNTWTDEDTGDEGTGEETFREDPAQPTDATEFSLELDATNWADNDDDLAEDGGRSGKKSYAETARMFKLRRNLDQLDCFHRQKEHNVLEAREELKVCRLHISELERQRERVEEEIEQQKEEDNSVAVFRLRAQHKRLCQELQREEELESHVANTLREHELELCQVEVELGRFSLLRVEVQEEEQAYQVLQAQRGEARLQKEDTSTQSLQLRKQCLKARQAAIQREEETHCQRTTELAQASHQKAALYLKETINRMHREEAEKEQQSRGLRQKRMQAVLSLKANIAATQESLRAQQTRAKAQARRQEEEERQLRESLQTQGTNSTKHMYQQKKLQDFHRKKEEFEEKQKSKRVEIVSKLLLEEELLERRKRRHALLFPPTQVSLVERLAGRGRSPEKVLQSLDPQPAETKAEKRKREHPTTSSRPSQQDTVFSDSSSSSELSDQEESRDLEEEQGLTDSLAQPEFTGLWDQKRQVHQSTPNEETKSLQSQAERQNLSLLPVGKPPVAGKRVIQGKEFKGSPFISKPEIVLFKDFEVGQTYKKKVNLTNVSYTTNYCKLLGVTMDLMDFISISFEPPGPISAGMACDMQVIFQPMINKDLKGEVQFVSAAGPFSVPIRCTIKKCDLSVDIDLIVFGTHVVGQTISRAITLTNRGALGTRFTLVPSPCPSLAQSQHQAQALSEASSASTQLSQERSTSIAAASDSQESPASRDSGELKSERKSQKPSLGSDSKQSRAQTPAVPETLGGVEAASGRRSLASEQQEGGLALKANTEEPSDSSSDITIGKVREGEVGPFESVKLEIVFTPTIPGEAKLDFHIKFSDPTCEPISIGVQGMAVCVPVWVAQPSIVLKICMFDRLYQDSIVVQSRASTALRLTFEVCPELRNHMEILPKTGYIQARSSFNAQLKFLPRRSLFEDAKMFFDGETGVLEVPLTVEVADQVRPVPFTVHAVITSSDLCFDRTEVDFGHCSIYESVKTSVRLTNLALLPQDFGFLGIPQFVEVQPNDGFGTLLPLETLEVDLIFSAKKAGEYSFQLNCKSGINRDFPLSCHAVGVHPPLELSHSLVQFGGTAVGDCSTAVLHVVNAHTSRNEFTHPVPRIGRDPVVPVGPRLFAFTPPENTEISLTPRTGRVLPGQRCLVQVTFRPRLCDQVIREEAVRLLCRSEELRLHELERVTKAEGNRKGGEQEGPCKREAPSAPQKGKKPPPTRPQAKQALKEKISKVSISPKTDSPFRAPNPADIQSGSEEYAAGRNSLLHSFPKHYSRYVIPCFVSDRDPPQSDPQAQPSYSPLNTLYLELHCPAVRPPLVVTSSNGQTTINYNQVAVGQKVVKKLTVQNISQEALELRSSVLDLSGPFSLLNALRRLGPGATHTLLLAFTPVLGKRYRETVEIHSPNMTLEVTLCGVGVDPLVTSSHQGGLMDFGYLLEKERASQVFKLQNTSSLAVRFSVLLDSLSLGCKAQSGADCLPALLSPGPEEQTHPTVGTQNYSGRSVFSVTPIEGTIAPGKSQDITVTFLPDHESLHYSDRLKVELMNKSTVCVMVLKGAARSHIMYLCGGDPLAVPTDAVHPLPASGDSELTVDCEKPPLPVLLTLRGVYREGAMSPAVRELEVGCICSTQPVAKKNVEFSWEGLQALQQRGFSVEPTRGMVDAGHRRTITVIWTPPSGLKPNEVVQVCAPLTLRGDETEVYSVTLLALASRASQEPSQT